MVCSTCGQDNPPQAKFCGLCGGSLSELSETVITEQKRMVSLPDAVSLGFQHYADFRGRATRAEYWWWALFTTSVNVVLQFIELRLGIPAIPSLLFGLGTLIPSLSLGARRLHDINKTGWWQLAHFVLLIGTIGLMLAAILKGDRGANKHGPDPRSPDA